MIHVEVREYDREIFITRMERECDLKNSGGLNFASSVKLTIVANKTK